MIFSVFLLYSVACLFCCIGPCGSLCFMGISILNFTFFERDSREGYPILCCLLVIVAHNVLLFYFCFSVLLPTYLCQSTVCFFTLYNHILITSYLYLYT